MNFVKINERNRLYTMKKSQIELFREYFKLSVNKSTLHKDRNNFNEKN